MKLLIHLLLSTCAILVIAHFLPGISVGGIVPALLFAVILGIVNAVIRPILLLLTLPINILTLGLFTLVINALLILLTSYFVPNFEVHGFVPAFLFGIILAVVMWVLNKLVGNKD